MKKHSTSTTHSLVDSVGAGLSFACAIHCMAMPLLIAVLPLIGLGFFLSESAELVMVIGAVALAAGSLTWGYRHHRQWQILLVLGVALALIFIARFWSAAGHEAIFMALGGISLTAGHLVNRQLCRACKHCESDGD